jgi:cyclopropane-fatty-acyl-phospholipid synthase
MIGAIDLAERGLLPDFLLRWGIRRLCAARLAEPRADEALERSMREGPVAPVPEKANEQHYEVPPAFFERTLGKRLKYSGAFFPPGVRTLDEAEEAMLRLTAERAQLADGQEILELGCGWGSLTLWIAERFPGARVTAVSNSAPQGDFIRRRAPGNVDVVTADMNVFDTDRRFDRVVSVEMFEHMRNWPELLLRISRWLKPGGKLFVHVFAHRERAYPFGTDSPDDWMGRHFFTGGIMPSHGLLERMAGELVPEERWWLDGTHYARTAEAWLQNLDRNRDEAMELLGRAGGAGNATLRYRRWRLFFLACAECFGYRRGGEWGVSHHRLAKP